MPQLRLDFEESDTEASIANRVAPALDPGATIRVRGKTFRVLRGGIAREMPAGGVIYDVVHISTPKEVFVPKPAPKAETVDVEDEVGIEDGLDPSQRGSVAAEESVGVEDGVSPASKKRKREKAAVVVPAIGQQWATKDKRREPKPFTIIAITEGVVHADDGRSFKVERLNRYKLVANA